MKKEIQRKCQACAKICNRDDLIKITKLQDGSIKINPKSNELGRSMYVCKNIDCIKILIKKKRIKNALKISSCEEISKVEEELLKILE